MDLTRFIDSCVLLGLLYISKLSIGFYKDSQLLGLGQISVLKNARFTNTWKVLDLLGLLYIWYVILSLPGLTSLVFF
jgi:hypothetical protein